MANVLVVATEWVSYFTGHDHKPLELRKKLIIVNKLLISLRNEWLVVRDGLENELLFIAVDPHSFGKRLSGRSVARIVGGW
jgi:hypothetical protein